MLLVALLSSMTTWAQDPQIFAGFTATDGTENTSTETPNPEGYAKLVDGKYTNGNYTKWGTSIMSTPPGESGDYFWVDFHSDSPIVVASYILTTGNDNASYKGRNPKTGESVQVKPKRMPFFKAGKELKDLVNEE